ncbi:MAG: ribose-5-phosphate isomerase A, partial [Proteobacteria bacterium]|nr:ribose-5-phosphate isomerase A [Pseudomonadota bacterium]
MNQDQLKQLVGRAAVAHVPAGQVLGVGTGSTVDCFIDALAAEVAAGRLAIPGAVSSSERSTLRLQQAGIPVLDAGEVECLTVYIDGADEIDHQGFMIKGGGATLRAGVVTDNGGHILDVTGLSITDPLAFESEVNQWPGVVTVGVFARHKA